MGGPEEDARRLLTKLFETCLGEKGEKEAWVLNIGTEVVMGTVVNTNGSWLARKLTFLGLRVSRIIATPDRQEDVVEELRRATSRGVDLVVTTGGLGPTYDDSTSKFVAKAAGVEEVLEPLAYRLLLEKYGGDESRITEERLQQARIPSNSVPIPNPVGTAPGFALCIGKTLVASLPGVPREMTAMFEESIEPLLRRAAGFHVHEESLVMVGPREADIAPLVKRLAREHPDAYIKTHPSIDEQGRSVIRLQIVARAPTEEEARNRASQIMGEMIKRLREAGVAWTPGPGR